MSGLQEGEDFEYVYLNGKIRINNECNKPNIAVGLAAINKVIYNCGDHSDIQSRYLN